MTDRELLELAAKAAGYDIVWATDLNGFVFRPFGHGPRTMFSPLNNDGEALRLAVALRLQLDMSRSLVAVGYGKFTRHSLQREKEAIIEFKDGDELGCVRRAIVRAAAEIGKAMP